MSQTAVPIDVPLELSKLRVEHTLRHSAASVMLSAGVPLKVVSETFGHASVGITGDVYGHVSRDALTRLSDALA